MKNKLLFIVVFCILSIYFINAETKNDITNTDSNEKLFKRHFLLMTGIAGGVIHYWNTPIYFTKAYGGTIGTSIGYQYAFTKYFTFGGGASGILILVDRSTYDKENDKQYPDQLSTFGTGYGYFLFGFGDFYNRKIAFLMDIGGGYLISTKFGIYIKGFVIKLGYNLTGTFSIHCITLDFGYQLNLGKATTFKKRKYFNKKEEEKTQIKVEEKTTEEKIEEIKGAKEGDVIVFNDIIFYPDRDDIKPESFPVLEKIAQVLNERKNIIIEIAGYTNATGNPEEELELSVKRAVKVSRFLIKNGVEANRIKTSGSGALNLKESKIDEANRRVEIKILKVIK